MSVCVLHNNMTKISFWFGRSLYRNRDYLIKTSHIDYYLFFSVKLKRKDYNNLQSSDIWDIKTLEVGFHDCTAYINTQQYICTYPNSICNTERLT